MIGSWSSDHAASMRGQMCQSLPLVLILNKLLIHICLAFCSLKDIAISHNASEFCLSIGLAAKPSEQDYALTCCLGCCSSLLAAPAKSLRSAQARVNGQSSPAMYRCWNSRCSMFTQPSTNAAQDKRLPSINDRKGAY